MYWSEIFVIWHCNFEESPECMWLQWPTCQWHIGLLNILQWYIRNRWNSQFCSELLIHILWVESWYLPFTNRHIWTFFFAKVVSYDFKEERFAQLHRTALLFPEGRFFFSGTPATPAAREAALKGEAAVRSQFLEDPYGCLGSLRAKKLKRDPFHRIIPYPDGCPELKGLFSYCGPVPYSGHLPWTDWLVQRA